MISFFLFAQETRDEANECHISRNHRSRGYVPCRTTSQPSIISQAPCISHWEHREFWNALFVYWDIECCVAWVCRSPDIAITLVNPDKHKRYVFYSDLSAFLAEYYFIGYRLSQRTIQHPTETGNVLASTPQWTAPNLSHSETDSV